MDVKKKGITDDVATFKIRRELNEKASEVTALQAKIDALLLQFKEINGSRYQSYESALCCLF